MPRSLWGWPALSALVVHLLVFAPAASDASKSMLESDAAEYWQLGRNITAHHEFSQSEAAPFVPDVRRTPIFPLFIAAITAITGGGTRTVVAAQVVLSIGTVVLLVRSTALLFGRAAATLSGVLLALDVTSAVYGTQLLTETLFTFLVVSAVFLAVRPGRRVWTVAALSGAGAGLAALCRPIGILVSAALWPAFARTSRPDAGRAISLAACAIGVSVLVLGTWVARNALVGGAATVSSVAATNTYFHRAAYVQAWIDGRPVDVVRREWEEAFDREARGLTPREQITWLNAHGRALIVQHPSTYAAVWIAGVARMFMPDDNISPRLFGATIWHVLRPVAWLQVLVVYVLAVRGAITSIRTDWLAAAVPLAVLAYFLVVSGPEMYPRFRVPLMPFICMLAGAGVGGVRATA